MGLHFVEKAEPLVADIFQIVSAGSFQSARPHTFLKFRVRKRRIQYRGVFAQAVGGNHDSARSVAGDFPNSGIGVERYRNDAVLLAFHQTHGQPFEIRGQAHECRPAVERRHIDMVACEFGPLQP